MASNLSKEETESLLSSGNKKKSKSRNKREEKKAPIENVEFLSSPDPTDNDKQGWGKSSISNAGGTAGAGAGAGAGTSTTGKVQSSRSLNSGWSYSTNSNADSNANANGAPSNAAAASANAAIAMEYGYQQQQQQQQQQQAFYAQQFYMQQQQHGYVPWPAPQFSHAHMAPSASIPQAYRRSNSNPNSNINSNIKKTMSNGSEDDEHAALLHQKFQVSKGYGGYGSTTTTTINNNNDNGRVSPVSNASSNHNKRSILVRKDSAGSGKIPPPPPSKAFAKPKHRRAQSDGVSFNLPQGSNNTNVKSQHPLHRTTSKEKPPMSKSPGLPVNRKGTPSTHASPKPKHKHSRSLSAGGMTGGLPLGLSEHRRTHRRVASNASSVGAGSVASEASFMSITSDIRKSTFYGGVDKPTGKPQLHYPNEHIFVCTDDPALVDGKVYKVAVDEEAFEEYHRQAEDRMWEDDLEEMECQQHRCTCKCNVCVGCAGHGTNNRRSVRKDPFSALPANQFALAVDSTVYKRVLDEISQAEVMPCGLFFCGHHEDVAHPSVNIPLTMVIALFLTLGYFAWTLEA